MNPTGHDLADMIFTGALIVLHLAALAGLGYLLGRLAGDRRAKTAEALRDMWNRHTIEALKREKEAAYALELCRDERNRAKVEAMKEIRDEIRDCVNRLANLTQEVEHQRGLLALAHRYVPTAALLWAEIHTAIKAPKRPAYQSTEDTGEPD